MFDIRILLTMKSCFPVCVLYMLQSVQCSEHKLLSMTSCDESVKIIALAWRRRAVKYTQVLG